MLLLLIVIINYFDFLDITDWGTGGGEDSKNKSIVLD